jgi:hypothetical protein
MPPFLVDCKVYKAVSYTVNQTAHLSVQGALRFADIKAGRAPEGKYKMLWLPVEIGRDWRTENGALVVRPGSENLADFGSIGPNVQPRTI